MAQQAPIVGIDLGTTNSVAACIDPHGRPVAMANSDGDLLTPSVVYFEPDGPAIVGKEAINAGLLDPVNMIVAIKREMGKDLCSRPVRGKPIPPAAISGVILHKLIQDVSARLGPITHAVVTVPAYFNEPRRKATVDAAHMAGLKDVELLNEPTAAALAFGFEMGVFSDAGKLVSKQTKIPGQFTLLVYDLGGGTFDVTLMKIKDQHFQALVCDGDVQLGGRDWDERILNYASDCFVREFDADPRADERTVALFAIQAEELKRSLSARTKNVVRLQFGEHRLAIEMTRDDLVELTSDLLQRTRMTCELAMMDARLTWDKVDSILLVGGASRMPMVHDMLVELTGLEPNRTVSPDQAVAQGAALYAQMLWGLSARDTSLKDEVVEPRRKVRITNINSHSLGIVAKSKKADARKVSILIPKHTPIPHTNRKTFKTQYAGQDKIFIQIVEGESASPEECTVIGECRLLDLPANLPAGWPVTVAFAYRRDGRIFVEAEVQGSQPFQVEIDRRRAVSKSEMEAWASELISDDDESQKQRRGLQVPPSRIKVARVKPKAGPAKKAPKGEG